MLTKCIRENSVLKWVFHGIFVATFLLVVNEIHFFQSCQRISKEFIEATKGMVLFEARVGEELSDLEPGLRGKLETYLIRTKTCDGEPVMEVATDATSSTFFKLEHSQKIQTSALQGIIPPAACKEAKQVFFGSQPTVAVGLKGDSLNALTKKWAYWKLGLSLFEESLLLQKMGLKWWCAFAVFFVCMNALFASVSRHSTSGLLNLRFFGLPNSTLIPFLILKNSLVLLLSFSAVALLFMMMGIYIAPFIYILSFFSTIALSSVWSFFGTLNLHR
ncbi:MAG: hypothetical protein ACOYK9_00905 [Chlamydiia bacterium]